MRRRELRLSYWRLLFQALGGIVLMVGAYTAWLQIVDARSGQLTDRFIRAVDQLGDTEAIDVRVGGIYSLERIARDSERDRRTVAEVLSAFVVRASTSNEPERASEATDNREEAIAFVTVPSDVRAAVTAIVRMYGRGEQTPFDLRGANLRDVRTSSARLRGAKLDGADLRDTHLGLADLRDAELKEADLRGAHLGDTDLRDAMLNRADLRDAILRRADLRGTSLDSANLRHSDLGSADLDGAVLNRANLRDAWIMDDASLRGTWLNGAKLPRARLGDADLHGARLMGADLREAQLFRADLREAQLFRADLRKAQLFRADLRGARLRRADLRGAALEGADLRTALLDRVDLRGACYNSATDWPEDFDAAGAGAHQGQDCGPEFLRPANP